MDALSKLNDKVKATSILYFDFSTLYTKIFHYKLLKILNKLIDFCFKKEQGEFISVDGHGPN